jgi:hypothetical protein
VPRAARRILALRDSVAGAVRSWAPDLLSVGHHLVGQRVEAAEAELGEVLHE